MFEKYIPFADTLQGHAAPINSHIVGHCLWGISSFVIGFICVMYMQRAKNKSVAFWIGIHFLLIFVYCCFRVLSVWQAYYNITTVVSVFLGLVSTVTMFLMIRIILTVEHIETVQRLEEKIKHYEELKTENDATDTLV